MLAELADSACLVVADEYPAFFLPRMLQGGCRKITALQTMLHLNDKFALDGCAPNSISGTFWCLGRYDRAWGAERPIYGKISNVSSENTARKFSVKSYLLRYTPGKETRQ